MVYCSQSPSLALLETLVWVPMQYFGERTLVELDVPDENIEEVGNALMFRLVNDAPDEEREILTRNYGTRWLREGRSLGLLVTSAVMPMERNLLLNPEHPDMQSVSEHGRQVIALDPRLLGRPSAYP
jgi:RES domain-containing protein